MKVKAKQVAISILILCSLYLIIAIVSGCKASVSDEEKLVSLYANAYACLIDKLSEANLLPQFETVELVEESLGQYLSGDSKSKLVKLLDDNYPYSIYLSQDHDRNEESHNQLPYDERGFVYVYLSPDISFDREFVNSNYNKAKIEGFINKNEFNVIMEYKYSKGSWELVKAELWEVDFETLTSKLIS